MNRETLRRILAENTRRGYLEGYGDVTFAEDVDELTDAVLAAMSATEITDEQANADYREVFGKDPEPWRGPLGALRLTLAGDAPWTLERARGECEELVRVLNDVEVTSVREVTETVWHKDQFYVTIETDAEGLVAISDELLVKLMTESGWVLQS